MKMYGREEVQLHIPLTSALDGDEWEQENKSKKRKTGW
jgi:hypothetical protein